MRSAGGVGKNLDRAGGWRTARRSMAVLKYGGMKGMMCQGRKRKFGVRGKTETILILAFDLRPGRSTRPGSDLGGRSLPGPASPFLKGSRTEMASG